MLNPYQDRKQTSIAEQVPIREIADSIFEMLTRIAQINANDPNNNEYRALLGRIKTQAYCMQLVLEDQRGSSSHQCNNIIQRLQYIYDDPNVHHLVKHCIVEIAQIINGNKKSKDYLKYTPNIYGSPNIVTALFKSQNYIDERERLAQNNPQEYLRQDKLNIHGFNQDKNSFIQELYSKNFHGSISNAQRLDEEMRHQVNNEIRQNSGDRPAGKPSIPSSNKFVSLK